LPWRLSLGGEKGATRQTSKTSFSLKVQVATLSAMFRVFSGRSRRKLDAKNNSRFIDVGLREKFVGLIEKLGNGDSENESKLNLNAG
jgi:hypothetical protein